MNNPFEPPRSAPRRLGPPSSGPQGTGTLDISRSVSDAWSALTRNLGVLWLSFLVLIVTISASVLACVLPVLVVGPVVAWGYQRLLLQAHDGEASLNTLFEGFQDVGSVWIRMVGIALSLGALTVAVVGVLAGFVGLGYAVADTTGLVLGLLLALPVFLAFLVVLLRFQFATPMIVDAPIGPLDALSRSWEETAPVWLTLVLQVLAIFAISVVINLGQTIVLLPIQLGLAALGEEAAILGVILSAIVSLAITPLTSAFTSLMLMSAYRQVVGSLQAD